jgi:hypothetical protein
MRVLVALEITTRAAMVIDREAGEMIGRADVGVDYGIKKFNFAAN